MLLCVSMLAVLLTGCSGGKGTAATGDARILIATCAKGDAFRDMLIAALESACDEQGIGHDTVYAEQSAEQQVAQVKEAKSQGYTAVICRLIDVDTALQVERAADGLPVYNLIFAIGSMIGVGSATRYTILKAQEDDSAKKYFANAILCILIISIPFVLSGIFSPDTVMHMMGADAGITQLGRTYTRIFLLFTPFFMMNYVFSAFVRNDNAPTLAMIGTMMGSFSNVVLDYVFMFPMGMGLAGAALATAASPIVSILICSIHFFQKKNTVQFAKTRPSVRMLTASCQLGVPAFVGEFSSGVTTTLFNYLILGLAGNVGVAAYGVIANFALIFTCIFNGISQGAQPLVSRYYGEGNERAVKKILHLGLATGVVFSLLIISLVWGFTDPMVALFNSEHSVKMAEYAFTGMRLYVIGFLFAGFNIIGTGYLSASEHAKEAFTASVCRGFVAIAVCSVILSRIFGIRGVWLSFMAAEVLTAGITAWALLKDRKKEAMA